MLFYQAHANERRSCTVHGEVRNCLLYGVIKSIGNIWINQICDFMCFHIHKGTSVMHGLESHLLLCSLVVICLRLGPLLSVPYCTISAIAYTVDVLENSVKNWGSRLKILRWWNTDPLNDCRIHYFLIDNLSEIPSSFWFLPLRNYTLIN
jgi:hypothetical protein